MSRPRRASSRARDRAAVALAGLGLLLAGSFASAEATETAGGVVAVVADQAKIIRLPPPTQTVVIGNPGIADITVQKNGVVILTGKSYGTTNMIALDAAGAMLAETLIEVRAPEINDTVTVTRATERQSYSCTPTCMPKVHLGDETKYLTDVSAQVGARNSFAAPKESTSR